MRIKLLVLFALSFLFTLCTKHDQNHASSPPISTEDRFFEFTNVHEKSDILSIINEMKIQNKKDSFVSDFITWHGYPKWDSAITIAKEDASIWLIPIVKDSTSYTNAYLVAKKSSDSCYFEIHRWDVFARNRTATESFKYFSQKENETIFKFFNRQLFDKANPTIRIKKKKPLSGNWFVKKGEGDNHKNSRMQYIMYCEEIWYDPDGDNDPCDCSGNEVFDHVECNTIWYNDSGGGGVAGSGNGSGSGTGIGVPGTGSTGSGGNSGGGTTTPCDPGLVSKWYFKLPPCDDGGTSDDGGPQPYDPPPSGPKICRSSFSFEPQGVGSKTYNSKVWGLVGVYKTPAQTYVTAFGMDIYPPTQIEVFPDALQSKANYPLLWLLGDISTKTINGKLYYTFSKYALQVIIADATDYASFWANGKILALGGSASSSTYKTQFRQKFLEWTQQYLPGTTMNILHSNVPGTTNAVLKDTNDC